MNRKFSPAQMAYMKALAAYETVRDIEKECKLKVLSEHEFFPVPEWGEVERIPATEPITDYLMSDSDFEKYCKLVYAEYQKRGIAGKDHYAVPSWPYHKALMDAENALIEWTYEVLRTKPEWKIYGEMLEEFRGKLAHHLQIKKQVVELAMRLAA
jgi:GNAT superfamily N-acetyltransferase